MAGFQTSRFLMFNEESRKHRRVVCARKVTRAKKATLFSNNQVE